MSIVKLIVQYTRELLQRQKPVPSSKYHLMVAQQQPVGIWVKIFFNIVFVIVCQVLILYFSIWFSVLGRKTNHSYGWNNFQFGDNSSLHWYFCCYLAGSAFMCSTDRTVAPSWQGGGYFRERHMTLHLTFRLLRQWIIKKIEFLQDAHNGEGNS